MARPTDKKTLLKQSAATFDELISFVDKMPDVERLFPQGTMNRNVRDVLMHLHAWHQLFSNWYVVGMDGQKPMMPAEGYGWGDTPALNKAFWEASQAISLAEAKALLLDSYEALQTLIERHSEAELFTKKYYPWTGTTSLASYLISATSSHYEWALRLIKKAQKKMS